TVVAKNQQSRDPTQKPRQLEVTGVTASADLPIGEALGSGTFKFRATQNTNRVIARVAGGDRWPENDQLELRTSPTDTLERWLVSSNSHPRGGWKIISPEGMPIDSAGYLSTSIIVLDDVPADALRPIVQQRLQQY